MAKEEYLKHFRIAEIIRSEIAEMAAHDVIPTERQMTERFGVSRVTIQKALEILTMDGLIYRKHGSGSYVAPHRPITQLKLRSFSEEMALRGMKFETKVLNFDLLNSNDATDSWAKIDVPVFRIERLRTCDKKPISWDVSYISRSVAPNLKSKDLSGSLYKLLEDRYEVEISSADETIMPALAKTASANLLQISKSSPVLEVFRNGYSALGELIESTKSVRRGDLYNMQFTVRR